MTSILATGTAPSLSRPGHFYAMIRTPSGWQHDGDGCERFFVQPDAKCRHISYMEGREKMEATETILEGSVALSTEVRGGILVEGRSVALAELIDEFDADLIVHGVDPELVEKWCYGFRQDGGVITGLSVHGVAAAAREMAKHGEIVRCEDPRIVFENDDEIRLSCTAVRFVIHPETGQQIELDRSTRGLRQTKFQMVNVVERYPSGAVKMENGRAIPVMDPATGRQKKERSDDPKWFEKAFSKAQRNAMFPLLREDCKTAILRAYKETPKYKEITAPRGRQDGGAGPDALPPGEQPARRAPSQRRPPAQAPAARTEAPHPAEVVDSTATPVPGDPTPEERLATPEQIASIKAIVRDLYESARETFDNLRKHIGETYPEVVHQMTGSLDHWHRLTETRAAALLADARRFRGDPD